MEGHAFSLTCRLYPAINDTEQKGIALPARFGHAVGKCGEPKLKCLLQTLQSGVFRKVEQLFDASRFSLREVSPHVSVVFHRLLHTLTLLDRLKPHAVQGQQVTGIYPDQLFKLFSRQILQSFKSYTLYHTQILCKDLQN